MSEVLAKQGRTIERPQIRYNFRFGGFSWLCDGHECPSYFRSYPAAPNT